jgi:predicted secreted protein
MIKFIFAIIFLNQLALASPRQVIDTLGVSPKGQYVALEEYGYKIEKHSYYVTIRIINVWKKEYVGTPIEVELPAARPHFLKKAREKAKLLAQDKLKRFQISG